MNNDENIMITHYTIDINYRFVILPFLLFQFLVAVGGTNTASNLNCTKSNKSSTKKHRIVKQTRVLVVVIYFSRFCRLISSTLISFIVYLVEFCIYFWIRKGIAGKA